MDPDPSRSHNADITHSRAMSAGAICCSSHCEQRSDAPLLIPFSIIRSALKALQRLRL